MVMDFEQGCIAISSTAGSQMILFHAYSHSSVLYLTVVRLVCPWSDKTSVKLVMIFCFSSVKCYLMSVVGDNSSY
jgi:hypothetical protein